VTTMTNTALMQLVDRPPSAMLRGSGSYLWDERDKRYLDFVQGWAVNCLGHSPHVIKSAIEAQLERVINVGPAYHNQPALVLAEQLAKTSQLERVFFLCTGAEANEGAVKLARKWGQKHKGGAYEVITTDESFHGRTLAMMAASGKPGFDTLFPPAVPGFRKVPFGDVEAVGAALSDATVAVMVEPIQGEAGVVLPPAGYLQGLRTLCDQRGVLLIADEIQTGMARTGPLYAHQADGVLPDIMTLGKGLGGGLPLSALLCRDQVACFEPGDQGGTFAAHALLCAVGLAVLERINEPGELTRRAAHAALLERSLGELAARHGLTLRGRGFLWALVLQEERAKSVRDRAFDAGLLLNAARPNVLRLMPSLEVSSAEIAEMTQLLSRALS
jgi:acetylornithine/N-succinyldiaminopimelate aminotransferase